LGGEGEEENGGEGQGEEGEAKASFFGPIMGMTGAGKLLTEDEEEGTPRVSLVGEPLILASPAFASPAPAATAAAVIGATGMDRFLSTPSSASSDVEDDEIAGFVGELRQQVDSPLLQLGGGILHAASGAGSIEWLQQQQQQQEEQQQLQAIVAEDDALAAAILAVGGGPQQVGQSLVPPLYLGGSMLVDTTAQYHHHHQQQQQQQQQPPILPNYSLSSLDKYHYQGGQQQQQQQQQEEEYQEYQQQLHFLPAQIYVSSSSSLASRFSSISPSFSSSSSAAPTHMSQPSLSQQLPPSLPRALFPRLRLQPARGSAQYLFKEENQLIDLDEPAMLAVVTKDAAKHKGKEPFFDVLYRAPLGRGGFACTVLVGSENGYEAGREFALKGTPFLLDGSREGYFREADVEEDAVFRGERAVLEIGMMRTMREAGVEGVMHIVGAAVCEGVVWVLMEYGPGGALSAMAGDCGERMCLIVARMVLRVTEELAGLGIMHRDIKPDNMVLDKEGQPALIDFNAGERKKEGEQEEEGRRWKVRSGEIRGTPQYLAPEVEKGGEYDHRSEIFSLGRSILELVFGFKFLYEEVWKGKMGVEEVVEKLRGKGWTTAGREFVRDLLSVDPEERPSYADLEERWEPVLAAKEGQEQEALREMEEYQQQLRLYEQQQREEEEVERKRLLREEGARQKEAWRAARRLREAEALRVREEEEKKEREEEEEKKKEEREEEEEEEEMAAEEEEEEEEEEKEGEEWTVADEAEEEDEEEGKEGGEGQDLTVADNAEDEDEEEGEEGGVDAEGEEESELDLALLDKEMALGDLIGAEEEEEDREEEGEGEGMLFGHEEEGEEEEEVQDATPLLVLKEDEGLAGAAIAVVEGERAAGVVGQPVEEGLDAVLATAEQQAVLADLLFWRSGKGNGEVGDLLDFDEW